MATIPYYLTSTANVGDANGGEIDSVVLTPAAAVATAVVRENGSGGTIILALQAAANGGSVQHIFRGLVYSGQLHVTLAGAGVQATVEL